jgi:hypothetical protein
MKFKDLMDVLSVNVAFEIWDKSDKNGTGVDFYTYMEDLSCHYKYADREIEIIQPLNADNRYKTKLLICLK